MPRLKPTSNPLRPSFLLTQSLSHRPISRRRLISAYGYTQAKALVYSEHGEPKDVLSLHTHSLPPPHKNLLTLRTLAAPINPADVNQIQGTYATLPPLTTALGTAQPSAVPGSEAVFEVLATGSAVTTARPGDWVLAAQPGLGTWRTHLQADEDAVHRIERDGLTRAQAATVAVNPVTAYRLLVDFAPVVERGWVVLNGANSGVGRAALQLCRRWGVRAIAIVRDRPSRADSAALAADLAALGATHVVSEAELLAGGLGGRVRAWTAGDEVRLGLDCVGGRAAGAMARLLSPGGQMVTYGAMGRRPLEVAAGLAIFRGLEFRGFWVSRWAAANAAEKRRTVEELLEMMRRGELVDGPVAEVPWGPGAGREELVGAVQSTLDGFRSGKGLFVFGDT